MGAVVAKEEAHIAERADWFDEDAPPTAVLQRLCFAPRDKRDGASYADDGYSDSALLRSRAERGKPRAKTSGPPPMPARPAPHVRPRQQQCCSRGH